MIFEHIHPVPQLLPPSSPISASHILMNVRPSPQRKQAFPPLAVINYQQLLAFVLFSLCEAESSYVAQAGLDLMIHLVVIWTVSGTN